jgi:hypothetical protein
MEVTKETFEEGCPIITINRSIKHIEALGLSNPTYAMMKDGGDKSKCPNCEDQCGLILKPEKATLLIHRHESPKCYYTYKPRYMFDAVTLFNGENPFGKKEFSANCALKIAQLFGCVEIRLIGFDALHGDTESVYGQPGKALLRQAERMKALIAKDNLCVKLL